MSDQTTLAFVESAARGVAIIGASGYVGRKVVRRLVEDRRTVGTILAVDVQAIPADERLDGVEYVALDVRSAELSELLKQHHVDCVVHLASVVNPPKGMSLHDQYSIDVDGMHNVVESCLTADVHHLIVTSSGAAYGYHADNPVPLREEHPLRGNDAFAYARHKRLAEESLARYREYHPELRQLIFRPGTILGVGTRNQITDFFERVIQVGVFGSASPFCFILDEDVAACIVKGVHERRTGVFNLAGDGVMTASEIAERTGARRILLPAGVMRGASRFLRALHLTKVGPEQVLFLQFRPVLANDALKHEFGFVPTMTSREVFEFWWKSRGQDTGRRK